jgi:hypothetical protein
MCGVENGFVDLGVIEFIGAGVGEGDGDGVGVEVEAGVGEGLGVGVGEEEDVGPMYVLLTITSSM